MAEENKNQTCAMCGKSVIHNGSIFVHAGGGVYEQQCQNCNWKGGQAGGVTQCPSCGDKTSLVNNHSASVK